QNYEGRLGWAVTPLTPELAQQLGLSRNAHGLVIKDVDPSGAAAEAGLQRGDVIEQGNRQPGRAEGGLKTALSRAESQAVLLLINRGGASAYVTRRQSR